MAEINVKVTAKLSTPLMGEPPMLDALLEWALTAHSASIVRADRSGRHAEIGSAPHRGAPLPPPGVIPIPLVRRDVSGWPVAAASVPIYRAEAEYTGRIARRIDSALIAPYIAPEKRRVINHGAGPFKAHFIPRRVRLIPRVVWFARAKSAKGRAPKATLRRELRRVVALGSKPSMGYGRVAEWIIEEIDDDYSWYAPADDAARILMRNLPDGPHLPDGLIGYRRLTEAVCPPYWHSARLTDAVVPC